MQIYCTYMLSCIITLANLLFFHWMYSCVTNYTSPNLVMRWFNSLKNSILRAADSPHPLESLLWMRLVVRKEKRDCCLCFKYSLWFELERG